jgi:hypothetical protein
VSRAEDVNGAVDAVWSVQGSREGSGRGVRKGRQHAQARVSAAMTSCDLLAWSGM